MCLGIKIAVLGLSERATGGMAMKDGGICDTLSWYVQGSVIMQIAGVLRSFLCNSTAASIARCILS